MLTWLGSIGPIAPPGASYIIYGVMLSIRSGDVSSTEAPVAPGTLMIESSISWFLVPLALSIEADWSIIRDISYRLFWSSAASLAF